MDIGNQVCVFDKKTVRKEKKKMSQPKKRGFLGALSGALVATGLATEDDPSSLPGPASATPPAATPPFRFTTPPSTTASTQGFVLDAEDQQILEDLRAKVYAIPSSYAVFARMREVLGSDADLAKVFQAVQAANPDVTSEKVCRDIGAHLQIVDTIVADFETRLAKDRVDNIDGKAREIARLTAEIEKARRGIEEHTARITQLENERQKAEQAHQKGAARVQAIKDQLTLPLNQAKELLSSHT